MVKAKAKAERAAARQAPQPTPSPTVMSSLDTASAPLAENEASPAPGPATEVAGLESEDAAVISGVKDVAPDRTEILRSTHAVGRFMQLLVPILIDVYAASVITPVRIKTLTGLLKAVSFMDADGLKSVLMVMALFTLIMLSIDALFSSYPLRASLRRSYHLKITHLLLLAPSS